MSGRAAVELEGWRSSCGPMRRRTHGNPLCPACVSRTCGMCTNMPGLDAPGMNTPGPCMTARLPPLTRALPQQLAKHQVAELHHLNGHLWGGKGACSRPQRVAGKELSLRPVGHGVDGAAWSSRSVSARHLKVDGGHAQTAGHKLTECTPSHGLRSNWHSGRRKKRPPRIGCSERSEQTLTEMPSPGKAAVRDMPPGLPDRPGLASPSSSSCPSGPSPDRRLPSSPAAAEPSRRRLLRRCPCPAAPLPCQPPVQALPAAVCNPASSAGWACMLGWLRPGAKAGCCREVASGV